MPQGTVNSNGAVLYYEDSGAPVEGSTTYVTLILVHGTMSHSAAFRHMMPYAASNNLRFVLLNCRDYPGSTRYTPEELALLGSTEPEKQAQSLQARALEFAEFARWFIQTEQIPLVSESGGGFSLLSWSSGNCQTLALLAYADQVPEDTQKLLDMYFKGVVIHDISLPATGAPPLEGTYAPFRDPSLSEAERPWVFAIWVSSCFNPVVINPVDSLESPGFIAAMVSRTTMHEQPGSDKDRWIPTAERMGPEKLAEMCDPDVMARSQWFYQILDRNVYQKHTRRALFLDCGQAVWSKLKVHVVWCEMTVTDTLYASLWLEAMARQAQEEGNGREIRMHKLENANHFVHYDEPRRFTDFFASIV